MALKENPAMVLKKFEELKKWQKLQEEKLRKEQEAQRELLMAAQRRMYEDYNRDLGGSSRCSYNDESLHHTSLESFPRIGSPVDIPTPAEAPMQNGRKSQVQPCVSFDDVPVPSPHKDFNELLGEKLRQGSDDKPKEGAPSKVVKRPFLRKGQGLVKYRLNDIKKPVQKRPSQPVNEKKNPMPANKPTQFSTNPPENRNKAAGNGPPIATWANILSKGIAEPTGSEQFVSRSLSPDRGAWTPSGSEASPNKPVGSNKLTKKELEDLRLFELLEQKAANSSFCSSSSTIIRLLEKSHQSTPNKTSARERQLKLRDFEFSPLQSNNDRSLHVRFADQNLEDFFAKPADSDLSSCDNSMDCGETDVVKNVPLFIGRDPEGQRLDKIDENGTGFEDTETWSDGCVSLESESSENSGDEEVSVVDKTIEGEEEAEKTEELAERTRSRSPSPTERLVRTAVEGVAYKSDLLRKRLQELEAEIETFRSENASLARMKRSHELELAAFAKERKETERAFREKQETLTNLLDVERKKLMKDKKVFEKYYKELKGRPNKMEREEIAALKIQVESLREELVKKDSRWSATQVRTRDRLKQLEAENVALKSQLADAKRQRQAEAKRRASLPNRSPSDTKVIHAINTHLTRLKPNQLKDPVVRKQPIPSQRTSLLANRPVWGSRQPPSKPSENLRRSKSVSDVRPSSPIRQRKTSDVRPVSPPRKMYSPSSSETEETEGDSNSDSEIDEGALARVGKLRDVVYDAYYGMVPARKPTKTVTVDLTENKENTGDNNRVAGDDEPEYLTAISKRIAYHKAKLQIDDQTPSEGGPRGSTAGSNQSSTSPPRKDSYMKTTESGQNANEKTTELGRNANEKTADVGRNPYERTVVSVMNPNERIVGSGQGSYERTMGIGQNSNTKTTELGQNFNEKTANMGRNPYERTIESVRDQNERIMGSGQDSYERITLMRQNSNEKATESERPVRQKTDSEFPTEVLKPNGSREKTFADGRTEVRYANGNVKRVSADRAVVAVTYFNGDVKETVTKEGLVKYFYAETKTWHSTYRDGTEVLEFANGQRERRTADGVSEITFPNGCVRVIRADGRDEWTLADGTRVTTDGHGEKVARLANGQREIHTATHKRREYPDGTVKLVYPDGLQETRYANGRIRIKDRHGVLVMDSAENDV